MLLKWTGTWSTNLMAAQVFLYCKKPNLRTSSSTDWDIQQLRTVGRWPTSFVYLRRRFTYVLRLRDLIWFRNNKSHIYRVRATALRQLRYQIRGVDIFSCQARLLYRFWRLKWNLSIIVCWVCLDRDDCATLVYPIMHDWLVLVLSLPRFHSHSLDLQHTHTTPHMYVST